MSKPIVAVIGRPNVGKSTLFNKLASRKISITKDTPGVTRDRIYADADWLNYNFILIDTGGLEPISNDLIPKFVFEQAQIAIETADLVLFVVDARDGITALDMEVAQLLRRFDKKVLLVANKIDNFRRDLDMIYEFYSLGFGTPIPVSAEQSLGIGDLLDEIVKNFSISCTDEDDNIIKVAIVGKPNVGKSSMINKILGQKRSIVSDIPGTTRDAVDAFYEKDGQKYIFIDTAGIRKKSKIKESLEYYSIVRAINAIERANVCILVINAEDGITEQDTKIAGIAHEKGKPTIIAINKWDKVEKDNNTVRKFSDNIYKKMGYMHYAPHIFVSALTGQRLIKIFDLIKTVWANANMRVKTGILNELILEAMVMNPPAIDKGKQLKIYYATQAAVCPPTFVLFVNNGQLLHFSYRRYLENQIRNSFGFDGVPIHFIAKNKYKD
jgi:ribosome-associated GTPase EngA